jgi:hypothetical protein
MMSHLTPEDLYSLEEYAKIRGDFRARVMAHKRDRKVPLGPHATLYFEDRLTMQYQVQEMLRVERIFEPEGIAEELGAYNPLIPDGSNWKATFMVEYADPEERRAALAKLIGIEEMVWVQVGDMGKVFAIANEDLDRSDENKTSSVHFMRFELDPDMIAGLKGGLALSAGCDHSNYQQEMEVAQASRESLLQDLQ